MFPGFQAFGWLAYIRVIKTQFINKNVTWQMFKIFIKVTWCWDVTPPSDPGILNRSWCSCCDVSRTFRPAVKQLISLCQMSMPVQRCLVLDQTVRAIFKYQECSEYWFLCFVVVWFSVCICYILKRNSQNDNLYNLSTVLSRCHTYRLLSYL